MSLTSWRQLLGCWVLLASAALSAHGAVLYDEMFAGNAADVLNGRSPTLDQFGGSNVWRAHTGFRADGSMAVPGGGSGAWLPFTVTPGEIYTLAVDFTNVTGDGNWLAIGFSGALPTNPQTTGNANRFISAPTTGKAWMLFRGNNSTNPNQTFRGDATSGTFAAGTLAWAGGPTNGGDVNLKIVLDTTGGPGNYTASFFAKRPTDATFEDVGGGPLTLNNTVIGAVGFAGSTNLINGTIERFTLDNGAGPPILAGDVNGDGFVTMADFEIIRGNLFANASLRSQGDLNADGVVNFTDFRLWKNAAHPSIAAQASLPEPSSLGLAAAAGGLAMAYRRRGSRRRLHS